MTAAGQTTAYTILVTNASNVALSSLQVDDPLLPTLVCSPVAIGGRLPAGASTTCTGSREVGQTDVDLGRVDNTVHVSGTSPQQATTQTSASAQVIIPADPSIVIDKTTTTPTVDAAGQRLAYTLLVTNDGNVTLTDVWPSDPSLPELTCTPVAGSSLAPGATMTCTGSRLATQSDINSGAIPNTATVHAERPGGLVDVPADDVTDSDAEIITPARMPAIDIEKTTTATGYTWAGEQIGYSFLVRNSGNVTLSQVRITDPIAGLSAISCDRVAPVTLNPGDEMTCTATKTVQQSEVDAGSFTNAATASGIGPGNQTVSDTSGVPLDVIAANALSLTKTASPVTITSGTQPVGYSLLAVNTGNQTLSNVTITDDLLTTLSCTPAAPATLAPGARMTCTGSYSATLADLDAGSILNTARVDGSAPTGPTVSAGDDFTVTVDQRPRLGLVKTPTPATIATLGEAVVYTFVASNTGNVTVSGVQITDSKPGMGALECSPAAGSALAPGESMTCTASRAATQDDLDAGSISNTAEVTGSGPGGVPVGPVPATATVSVEQTPQLSLDKTVTPTEATATTGTVNYRFVIANTGNVTVSNVQLTDPLPGLTGLACTVDDVAVTLPTTLAPGQQAICVASKPISQADIDAGRIVNTARATGAGANATTVTPVTDTATVTITQNPSVRLTKVPSPATVTAAGQLVTYRFTIHNDGDVTLNNLRLTDPLAGLSAITCDGPLTTLAVDATRTCTATRSTTQADLDAGEVLNTATLHADRPGGLVADPADDLVVSADATVAATQTPAYTLTKTSDHASVSQVGQVVRYTIAVRNSGNVTLTDTQVSDALLADLACTPAQGSTLVPGGTLSCTGSHTVTQADLDAGAIHNTASVTGIDPNLVPIAASGERTVGVVETPVIDVIKEASPLTVSALDELVTYTFHVRNIGNVTLSDVTVADDLPGVSALECSQPLPATLAPQGSMLCTATRATTQADLDAGSFRNQGHVRGTSPAGTTVTDTGSVLIRTSQLPALSLAKEADRGTFSSTDDLVTYTFTTTNTGNVTVNQVALSDTMPGLSTPVCTIDGLPVTMPTSLAPMQSVVCTATKQVTQLNLDAGYLTNQASVTGQTATGTPVQPAQDSITIPATQNPAMLVTKQASPTTVSAVGQLVTYTYAATNTGNVTLGGVVLSDPLPGLGQATCTSSFTLRPGETKTCVATRATTQSDLNAGYVDNTAKAVAEKPGGNAGNPDDDLVGYSTPVRVTATQAPALTLTKIASTDDYSVAGEVVAFTLLARNTGNVSLSGVEITDAGLGVLHCTPAQPVTLAPNATLTCTGAWTITTDDIDAGSITNQASASGLPPSGPAVGDTDEVTLLAVAAPELSLVKSADRSTFTAAGQPVRFTLTASNTGNTTMLGVQITDPLLEAELVCDVAGVPVTPPIDLAPGEQLRCAADHQTTQADIDAGTLVNTATVTGTDSAGEQVTDTDTVRLTGIKDASLSIVKTADVATFSAVDQQITFTKTVTNTGNVTLDTLTITDPLVGLVQHGCDVTTLAPGEVAICTGSYSTLQSDLDDGYVANQAYASALDPQDVIVQGEDSLRVPATQTRALEVSKTADPEVVDHVGQLVTFTLTATNLGNTTASNVYFNDTMAGLSTFSCNNAGLSTLAPGESKICTATYQVSQADLDAGSILNAVRVSASDSLGADFPDGPELHDSVTVTVDARPQISISKIADQPDYNTVGQWIDYAIAVTNTGNVVVTNVQVDDPMLNGTLGCTPIAGSSLAPGAEMACTGRYQITQDDLDAPALDNTATATAVGAGVNLRETATETVIPEQLPAIDIIKTSDVANLTADGQPVLFTVQLLNTGNVTMSGLELDDRLPGLGSWSCTPLLAGELAPGGRIVCSAGYLASQADLDAGGLTNTATFTATAPSGQVLPVDDTTEIGVTAAPALELSKSVLPATVDTAGEQVTYTFEVTNTGNLTIDDVQIADPLPGLVWGDCVAADDSPLPMGSSLAPGATMTCTATLEVDQQVIDAGILLNQATASGTDALDSAVTSPIAEETLDVTQTPGISFTKDADLTQVSAVGEVVTYTLTAANTGNVTLHSVEMTDPGATLDCPVAGAVDLAPGSAPLVCTATRTVTQDDIDAGSIVNTARADYLLPPDEQPMSITDDEVVDATRTIDMIFTKTADRERVAEAGEVITYTFTATNTGNVTLDQVRIADQMAGLGALACTPGQGASLAPTDTMVCRATKTVTAAEMDAPWLDNVATLSGVVRGGEAFTRNASERVIPIHQPALSLTKQAFVTDAAGVEIAAPGAIGDVIEYTFEIANTGNAVVDDVRLIDPMPGLSAPVCDPVAGSTLEIGGTMSCTASYTIAQTDLDSPTATIGNVATLTATDRNGDPVELPTASETVAVDARPQLALTKTSPTELIAEVDEVVGYQFRITNTGNITISQVTLADANPDVIGLDCGPGPITLGPGEFRDCLASYTVTQADMDAGHVHNQATASGQRPDGTALAGTELGSAELTIPTASAPSISVTKTANRAEVSNIGDIITYQLTIVNDGNTTLYDVTPDDGKAGLFDRACSQSPIPVDSLAPGAQFTCTANYRVTAADFDAQVIPNTAEVFALDPDGQPVSDIAELEVQAVGNVAASIVKTADRTTVSRAGDQINYSIAVRNDGNVTITDLDITDSMPGLALDCLRGTTPVTLPTSLAAGARLTCTTSHQVSQAEFDSGSIINVATLSGGSVAGPLPAGISDDEVVTAQRNPQLDLVKTASVTSVDEVGDPITFNFVLTNRGNTTLTGLAIDDELPGLGAITCPGDGLAAPLAPGASVSCSASYLTTHADLEAHQIVNVATASASSPTGPVSDLDAVTVIAHYDPALGLEKWVTGPVNWAAGDELTYNFRVTNTGTIAAHGVTITDPMAGLGPIDCGVAEVVLAPGESRECTASYLVSQADANAGRLTNTASVTATEVTGEQFPSAEASAVTTTNLPPAITLTKTADRSQVQAVGEIIHYEFVATNIGKVTVSGGGLTDILPGLRNLYCPPNVILDPQGTLTCTAEYEVTQADLDAGTIINEATATAADQRGRISAPASDGWVVTAVRNPVLTMTGLPVPEVATSPGERITYTVTLTNDGNVTLDDVTVDPLTDGMEVSGCLPAPLAPGESRTCILSQVVTQAQMDAGEVPAAVAGVATVRGGEALDPAPSVDLTIPTEQRPAISLSKNADVTFVEHPGDEIEYTLLLRNTGNVTLTDVLLDDDLVDLAGLSCVQPLTLAPGQVMACTVMYTVSQEVFDSGMVTSISTVTAQAPGPVEVTDDARIDIPVRQDPVLAVTKQADRESLAYPGELLNYLFIVTNIGDTTLTNLNLDDPMPGLTTVACDRMTLAPGESSYCQAGYPVTQDDIDAGDLVNTVTVTAVSPDGALAEESWATSRVPVIQRPELRLIKAASTSRVTEPGQVIHYAFLALNTGNVTAHNVQITDDLPGLSEMTCTRSAPVSLAPGDLVVCEASYVTTPADFAAGQVVNTAAVTGDGPFGLAIPPASDTRTVIASPDAQLIVRKTADVMTVDEPGDLVNYTFQLRNVGSERLDQLVLSDELPGMSEIVCDGGPLTSLEPGQSAVCHSSYTVTAADMERGTIRNVAQVSAVSASGEPVSERSADATVAAVPHQEITLTKTADPQVVRQADTTVTYTFTLTNNGTQTVTNPTIRDDMPGLYDWQCPDAGSPLAPGASRVCTAKFDMTQPRFEAGNVYNLATAYAFSRYGAPLATSAYNLLVVIPQPELGLTKTADLSSVHRVGEPITYTFTVTNTGNETVNAVRVVDPMLESISCGAGLVSMAPGDVAVCTGVGRPDQAALDAGVVVNRAVAIGEAASGDVRNPADDVRAVAEVSVPVTALPDAALRVTAEPGEVLSGEPVQFILELENTGNVSLTSVDWQFSLPVGTPVCQLAGPTARLSARAALVPPLAPGQTLRCTVSYVATPADAAAGSVVLEAIASGGTTALDTGYGPVRGEAAVVVGLPVVPPVPPVPSVPPVPPVPPSPPLDGPRPPDKPPRLPQTGGTPGTGTAIVAEWPPPAYLRRDEEE